MGWGWAISWVKETNYGVGLLAPLTSSPAYRPPPLSINGEGGIGLEWG